MTTKKIATRIQSKHDLEINWNQAVNFIPLAGELIVYDAEVDKFGKILTKKVNGEDIKLLPANRIWPYKYSRLKIGDGSTAVSDLPFVDDIDQYAEHTAAYITGHGLTTNRLAYLPGENIKVEYANSTAGWRALISGDVEGYNESSNYIIHNSTEDWVSHTVSLMTKPTTASSINIKFARYSDNNDTFLIKDVELTHADGTPIDYHVNNEEFTAPTYILQDYFDEDQGWERTKNTSIQDGKLKLAGPGNWLSVATRTIDVIPNTTYVVTIEGLQVTAGGTNVSVRSNSVKLASKYLSASNAGTAKDYKFTVKPAGNTMQITFAGDGTNAAFAGEVSAVIVKQSPKLAEYQDFSFSKASTSTENGLSLDSTTSGYWGQLAVGALNGLTPGTEYIIYFDAIAHSGGTNVKISSTGMDNVSAYVGNTELSSYTLAFTPTAESASLTFIGSGSAIDKVDILNLTLFPSNQQLGNIADVNNRRWSIKTPSYRTDDGIVLSGTQKYFVGAEAAGILVKPNTVYYLSYKTKRLNKVVVWKDFITMSGNDKVALVTGSRANNIPACGGPWTGAGINDDHRLKVTLYPCKDRSFDAEYLGLDLQVFGMDTLSVTVSFIYDPSDPTRIWSFTESVPAPDLLSYRGMIYLNLKDRLKAFPRFDVAICHSLEVTIVPEAPDSDRSSCILNNLFLYGSSYIHPAQLFETDADKNVYFANKITANYVDGTLDDGDLDEGSF